MTFFPPGLSSHPPEPPTRAGEPSPSSWRYSTHQPLDMDGATKKLRSEEVAHTLAHSSFENIETFVSTVPSQDPVQDRYIFNTISVGGLQLWPYWGVFDGHSGWATAKLLCNELAPRVSWELEKADGSSLTNDASLTDDTISSAICTAFTLFDDEIMREGIDALNESLPHAEAVCRLAPASSGSCAIMVFLDPLSNRLHVACVGDSRAVLGRKCGSSAQWTTEPLSIDQTGFNKAEVERIKREHPGESPVVDGRVLNCEVTRSFGDSRWKWSSENLECWQNSFWGRDPLSNYHSPPYLTAKPEVKSAKVGPGDFLIIASDGFWSHIESNEDAVHLVGMWLREKLGAEYTDPPLSTDGSEDKTRIGYPYEFVVKRSDFLVEDDNAATHLARNAFGGKNRDLFCSLLSTMAPDSKEARDDLTVMVVLF